MPQFEQFRLPDVGEGLTEADIVQWLVAVGDRVEINQPIVEIETAKSLVELPSPWAGAVTKLLARQGDNVAVGVPIIEVDTDPDGPAPQPATQAPAADAGTAAAPVSAPTQAAPSQSSEQPTDVLVGYGPRSGAVTRRPRVTRSAASVNDPATAPVAPAAQTAPAAPTAPTAPANSVSSAGSPTSAQNHAASGSSGPRVLAKPPVRKLARDLGLDLAAVAGTGPGGLVTREDVLAALQETTARDVSVWPGDDQPWLDAGTVSPDGRRTRVPVRSVRRRTAEAMVASAFTAPHVTVFHTLDVTRTMALVQRLKSDPDFEDVRVSPLLVVARALLLAVRRHPQINASWDDEAQEIVYKHYVNLGIAASTPRGLVVPNIKDAHRMTLHDIAVALDNLRTTARSGRTTPADMADGTITITNVGVFGIDTGTPILNPGESAILAFGAVRKQPWVHRGKVKPRWVTQLALSFDHRLVDGELGSRVLADVAAVLEEPAQALVWA